MFFHKVVATDAPETTTEKHIHSKPEKSDADHLAPRPPVIPILLGVVTVGFLFVSRYVFAVGVLATALAVWRYYEKIKRYRRHERALAKLTRFQDFGLLRFLHRSLTGLSKAHWAGRHRFLYSEIFEAALEDQMDVEEMSWLKQVASVLGVDASLIHEAKLKERMWGAIANGTVTDEEEQTIEELLAICELPADRFQKELSALRQFIAARPIQKGSFPSVDSDVSLPAQERCHHVTSGCLLEKKASEGSAEEEGQEDRLTASEEGKIYITSKRVLIVGEVTTSIPHEGILDAEIDPDRNVISITKDARREPLLLRVQDLIYTGILLEALSAVSTPRQSIQ